MMRLIILFILFPIAIFAQYEGIYDIPLPEDFDGMTKSITIYSSPNPDCPEYADETQNEIVWKHKTVIKANEDIKILETGAYLLNRGTWWRRAAFNKKQTKRMFAAKKLKLSQGDSIVFQENWRFGSYTQTGWNFWYVKGVTTSGEKVFGYEILETKGAFKDGTQIFPCLKSDSKLSINLKEGYKIESMSSTEIKTINAKITVKNEEVQSFEMLTHELSFLLKKYASENNFYLSDLYDVEEIPQATIDGIKIINVNDETRSVEGIFCMNGKCQNQVWEVYVEATEKTISLEFELSIEAEKYLLNFEKIKKENTSTIIPDEITLDVKLVFKKDYPGSMPWNDLNK